MKDKTTPGEYTLCPEPAKGAYNSLGSYATQLGKMVRVSAVVPLEDVSSMYKGSKQAQYDRAYQSLCTTPLNKRDSLVRSFVKREKLIVTAGLDTLLKPGSVYSKDPRVIQPRDCRFNCHLARFLKKNEHRVFNAINEMYSYHSPTIMKGLNATQQGEAIHAAWSRFKRPRGIRMDFSRFDQHVSKEALSLEHKVYLTMFQKARGLGKCTKREYKELVWLLNEQLENTCEMRLPDGTVKYKTIGKRMSGDINTGLGNVVLVCLMFKKFLDDLKLTGADYHFIDNGDDCCLVVEEDVVAVVLRDLDSYFIRLGFELEVEGIASELEHVKFCQSHPIEVRSGHWVMVRDCDVSRLKDATNLRRMTTKTAFNEWRAAIAGCGLALCSGIPIMQEFYLALTRGTDPHHRDVFTCGADFLARGMEAKVSPVTDVARSSFFMAWGITPDQQIEIEEYYKLWTPVFETTDEVVLGEAGSHSATC